MLKRMFALSDQGSKDLNKGIAATTLSNICLIIPSSILIMVIWELLNIISGESAGISEYVPLFCIVTVVLFIIVFLTQWLQYNKTYTVAYEESANRRIVLAEKLRRLPLSFFGQKNLSDLTTTIWAIVLHWNVYFQMHYPSYSEQFLCSLLLPHACLSWIGD